MSMTSVLPAGRHTLSVRMTTFFAVVAAILFSTTSSAPTPLYHLYQETMQLSAATVTLIFAAYAFAMLAAFLTVARLSDYVGRRPMMLVALLLNVAALVVFIAASEASHLVLARIVQGIATGIGMTTAGAAILDTDRKNGAVLNSVTALIGLTAGSLLAGVLVSFAPLPTELVYVVLLVVSLGLVAMLAFVPETTTRKPGALGVVVPRIGVPVAARPAMVRLMPLNVAAWALGGFYLSLMPSLVAVVTGAKSHFIGATVVSTLMLTASVTVFILRRADPKRLLAIAGAALGLGIALTLAGVRAESVAIMFFGTLVAGTGFGASYAGALRTLLPLADAHERAGLLAAYFVVSYLVFAVPTIAAGLAAPILGLVTTSYIYGGVLVGLAALSLLAGQPRQTRQLEI